MGQKPFVLVSILFYLLFFKVDALEYISGACTDTGLNYSISSNFENNLNLFLTNVTSKTSVNFYNNSVGSGPDKVFGLFQCRFDVGVDTCNTCVDDATRKIIQGCHLYREAIVWYQECMLRYANRNIFFLNQTDPGVYHYSVTNVTDYALFGVILDNAINGVIKNASSSSSRFASAVTNWSLSEQLFSFAQCTPDITSSGCTDCLAAAFNIMILYCPSDEWVAVFYSSCQLWYNTTGPILNDIVMSPPAPIAANNSAPLTPPMMPPSNKTSASSPKTVIIAAVAACAGVGLLVLAVVLWMCLWRKKPKEAINYVPPASPAGQQIVESDVRSLGEKDVVQYEFATLKAATGEFSAESKLGEGGFGSVYKGTLENGEQLAIKRLSDTSRQGNKEFMSEARLLAKLQHRNLVRLIGFCSEGDEKLLVYEFLSNSSLERFLFDPEKRPHLNWVTRHKTIVGIARGLQYLHEDSRITIVHRDLKPENILLDNEMNPKIADFGLARLFEQAQKFGNTVRIAGTRGYMAPECLSGEYSSKSDVYSFGVMLLEIISGQSNRLFNQKSKKEDLPIQAWILWNEGRSIELVDPKMDKTYSSKEIERCIQVGLLCVQADAEQRPTMTEVVLMLTVNSIDLTSPSPPVVTVPQVNVSWANNATGQQSNSDQFSTRSISHDLYPKPR